MSLAEDLVAAAAQAIDAHLHEVNDPGLAGDWVSSPEDFGGHAKAAVMSTLRVLVDKHFPDENVDYHYASEGFVCDAVDVLTELEISDAVARESGATGVGQP